MATKGEIIGGVIGGIGGGLLMGPAGAAKGYALGRGIGGGIEQLKGNEFTKAYDKNLSESLRKIRMGESLAPSAAEPVDSRRDPPAGVPHLALRICPRCALIA